MTPAVDMPPMLVVFLDPINLTIQRPAGSSGLGLAAFCRELGREATRFADMLDPSGAVTPDVAGQPRHALREPADDVPSEGSTDV